MDKKQVVKLEYKLKSKKPSKIKTWVLKALPVAVFIIVCIGVIGALVWYGDTPRNVVVDLGGGQRVDEVFAGNQNAPPQLPPIHDTPTRPPANDYPPIADESTTATPSPENSNCPYCSYKPTPDYSPCALPPLPAYLLCSVVYSRILTTNILEFFIEFNTNNRTAILSFLQNGELIELNVEFEVIGLNQLFASLYYNNEYVEFVIEVSFNRVLLRSNRLMQIIGFFNPFNPIDYLVLDADWVI